MPDDGRTRLLFGPYGTPAFHYGDTVDCLIRGEIEVVGLTDAPVPWPVGKLGAHKSMILYADLARAVRREAALAVAHWWGVTPQTVRVWRKALGEGAVTEGTRRLKRDNALEPGTAAARAKAVGKARDPERRRKIAEAARGRPKPSHVVEAVRKGRTGTRERMSVTHQARGTLVPGTRVWTSEEDDAVRSLPPKEAARRTGRTLGVIYARRRALGAAGVEGGRRSRVHPARACYFRRGGGRRRRRRPSPRRHAPRRSRTPTARRRPHLRRRTPRSAGRSRRSGPTARPWRRRRGCRRVANQDMSALVYGRPAGVGQAGHHSPRGRPEGIPA
jgi:hypothetical protein